MSTQKDTTTTIENKQDLLNYYKEAQKGFLKGLKGKFLKREFIEIDKKIVLKLNSARVIQGKTEYFENYMFILNNYTYTLMFVSLLPNDSNLEIQKPKY